MINQLNMNTQTKLYAFLMLLGITAFGFTACQKDNGNAPDNELLLAKETSIAFLMSNGTVSANGGASTQDSIHAMDACKKGDKKQEVAAADLSASITTYLSTNYAGYTFHKAFKVLEAKSTTTKSFVVIIKYNDKPVALQFDAKGAFVKVLELREARDLRGKGGWHIGGQFEHRDGKHRDTIAISALPVAVKAYFTANYPTDTLLHAELNKDASLVVLSKNNGIYANEFTAASVFIKRIKLQSFPGKCEPVAQTALLAATTTYLSTTYPNYVFKQAFAIKSNGSIKGYVV